MRSPVIGGLPKTGEDPAATAGLVDDAVAKLFPDSAYQLTHNALFPKNCMHIENLGGEISAPEIQNRRLIIGCFPWKFKGGEAAFCRAVAWA